MALKMMMRMRFHSNMTNKSAYWGIDIGHPSYSPTVEMWGRVPAPRLTNMANQGAGVDKPHISFLTTPFLGLRPFFPLTNDLWFSKI